MDLSKRRWGTRGSAETMRSDGAGALSRGVETDWSFMCVWQTQVWQAGALAAS